MNFRILIYIICTYLFFPFIHAEQEFPVLYKGRFRPIEAYAKLWLYEFYHSETIQTKDIPAFQTDSTVDFVLKLEVLGHTPWNQTPLFWIKSSDLKKLLGIEIKKERFSYETLQEALYKNPLSSRNIFWYLITQEFLKNKGANKDFVKLFQSKNIPGVQVQFQNSHLILTALPKEIKWQSIKKGDSFFLDLLKEKSDLSSFDAASLLSLIQTLRQFEDLQGVNSLVGTRYEQDFQLLKQQNRSPEEIARTLENSYPLSKRLTSGDSFLTVLPSVYPGIWLPLNALNIQVYSTEQQKLIPLKNFTLFSNDQFNLIKESYLEWKKAVLTGNLSEQKNAKLKLSSSLHYAYQQLAGKPYNQATGKALYYPIVKQLKAESIYYQYAWVKYLVVFYVLSTLLFLFAYRLSNSTLTKLAIGFLILSFVIHTLLLFWRSYLLNRPPVSNMFETLFYVPWVAVLGALFFYYFRRSLYPLIAATLSASILLTIIEFTEINQSLNNVQAILDSQFWLFVHVLLVVGSYGLFILGAVLAHFYLVSLFYQNPSSPSMQLLSNSILQSIYTGLAMLIPGTLLGGVWAAESWGRFWDWDPKESWAFISICIYLVWVHAYHYHKIGPFGLGIGAITGVLAISFTWYGVNYILGTGLHSYGFGSGGEIFYYIFLGGELVFVIFMLCFYKYFRNKKFLKNQD